MTWGILPRPDCSAAEALEQIDLKDYPARFALSGLPMIVNAVWTAIDGTGIPDLAFSGTSLLIVVGVALETFRELEAQMTLRNYKGFLD